MRPSYIRLRAEARIGSDPNVSVFYNYQKYWMSENNFTTSMPQALEKILQSAVPPIEAVSYLAADGIVRYLQSPGCLLSPLTIAASHLAS